MDTLIVRAKKQARSSAQTPRLPASQITTQPEIRRIPPLVEEYLRIGACNESHSKYLAAEQHYLRAMQLASLLRTEMPLLWVSCARSLSLFYAKTQRHSMARWYARRVLSTCMKEGVLSPDVVKSIAFYGALLYNMGNCRSALRYLKRAYLCARRLENFEISLMADVGDLLADVYHQRQNHCRAQACERLSRRLRQYQAKEERMAA